MGLLEDLAAKKAEPRALCLFGKIVTSIEDEATAAALEGMVDLVRIDADLPQAQRLFTIAWLHSTLVKNGYAIGKTAVGDHIRKKCICERS